MPIELSHLDKLIRGHKSVWIKGIKKIIWKVCELIDVIFFLKKDSYSEMCELFGQVLGYE